MVVVMVEIKILYIVVVVGAAPHAHVYDYVHCNSINILIYSRRGVVYLLVKSNGVRALVIEGRVAVLNVNEFRTLPYLAVLMFNKICEK